jgi:signal peptidase II
MRGLACAAVVIALDQLTKWLMLAYVMTPPRVIEVTPFFNIVYAWNRGISFGLFNAESDWNRWILSGLAIVIVGFLLAWLRRAQHWLVVLALGLIIGGALGNVIDRLRFGAVFDFLDLHAAGYHWPAFNLADSAITVGVTLLIIDTLFAISEPRTSVPREGT